ncbi:hypothetical protein ACHWQZ_G013336 [Mnemiopsis leidyi]
METPVYQELSWNTAPQPCKQKDYRLLEQRRNAIIQSLQQSPANRVDLEKQLHNVQTEMYMYQNSQKQNYNDFHSYRTPHLSSDPPPMESDLMDMLGMPQSGNTWNNKQLIDSGIASGSTTSPPSDDGGNNDYQNGIDEELAMHNIPSFDWDVPFNKSSFNQTQSRSQRLRAELFPDASEEQHNPAPTPSHASPTTPVTTTLQTLGEPTPVSHNTMENIAHYQDDAELAMQAIPEFAKLLSSKNPEVQVSVTTCIHALSKKEPSMHALLSYPQLISTLLHTLSTATDQEVVRCCTGTLHNLSYLREGLESIQKYRGIPILCELLSNSSENVLYYTITTLHNMIQRHKSSQLDICLSGGLEKMVSVLKYSDKPQFVAMVAECIHMLCHRNPDKKQAVAACSGPLHLVKLLQTSSVEYVTWAVARALKTLSVCNKNKKCILEAGGMQALARHLDTGSQRVTEEVLYTMRNLSNAVKGGSVDNVDPILTKLMDVLARTNINLIACSVGCLSNLTCNNPNNKKTVFRAGGLDTLLRCLLQNQAIPSVAEPLLCTLRHINYKHSEYEQTQHAFRTSGGISLITKVLSTAQHWAVIKAACGLIRNLALNAANIPFFKETGLLLHLIQACLRITDHYKGGINENRDGIKLEDIMWESLKTLESVSCHPEIRAQLDNPISAHLLMKCINSNNENLVQVALSSVVQFESHENFMVLIKNDPRFELIGKLCHFRNPKIAQMAAVLSNRLNEVQVDVKPPTAMEQPPHQTPGIFVNGGVQWGESVPHVRTENGSAASHLNDVVDLDATTAQYRNDSFIKSPGSMPVVPPGAGGPLQPSPHQQYSPRYHAPSPHVQQSTYNGVAFPTTYSTSPHYTTQSTYHPFPGFHHTPYQPPQPPQSNRNWYAAI